MEQLDALKKVVTEINNLCKTVFDEEFLFFNENNLKLIKTQCVEFQFYQSISWLYVLYFECGAKNIDFIKKQSKSLNIHLEESIDLHDKATVHHIRTLLQHNLDIRISVDNPKLLHCSEWFSNCCGQDFPKTRGNWENCISTLISNALKFLYFIKLSVIEIQKLEPDIKAIYIDEWSKQRSSKLKPFEYKAYLDQILSRFGMLHVDSYRICKRYSQEWNKAVFETFEVDKTKRSKLIERLLEKYVIDFLKKKHSVLCPVGGEDIISLGVPKGQKIKQYLEIAYDIYEKNNYEVSKDNLLLEIQTILKQDEDSPM